MFPPAASLSSLPWEDASDAQILQARKNDGVKAAGPGSRVQRQKMLSGEKCRGLGGAVTQTAVIFQTRETQQDHGETLKVCVCCVEKGGTWYIYLYL